MIFTKNSSRAFTLIELLVVISIISLLSSIVLASLKSVRVKARDAKRASDTSQIVRALALFYDVYNCLPSPGSSACGGFTADSNAGLWDYSSQGGFLSFLSASGVMPNPPVDPLNNMTGDGVPNNTYAYRYYCYAPSSNPLNPGLHLGYWSETQGAYIKVMPRGSNWTDSSYTCR